MNWSFYKHAIGGF